MEDDDELRALDREDVLRDIFGDEDEFFVRIPNWGVPFVFSGITYAEGLKCSCGWPEDDWSLRGMAPYIVGFSTSAPGLGNFKPGGRNKIGAVIYECPDCNERFWYHADPYSLRMSAAWNEPLFDHIVSRSEK